METTLSLLTLSAITFIALSVVGLMAVGKLRSQIQSGNPSAPQPATRKRTLRNALDGLLDTIGSMF
jgi:hypothetical protein